MKRFFWLAVVLLSWPAAASAITVDGTIDASYFAPVAIQDTGTGFGNNESELNAAYARLDASGNLSLMLTGNLQNNGNGLVIFIDSRSGGAVAEPLAGGYGKLGSVGGAKTDDWGNDTDGGAGVSTPAGGASILDPDFNPDISIEINAGDSGNPTSYYTNIIDMTLPNEPNDNRDVYLGVNTFNAGATVPPQIYTRPDGLTSKGSGGTIEHAFDNTNTAGVSDTDASTALTATTGYEAKISSEFLANTGEPIRILAFITNGGGDFLANQFLGQSGVAGSGNLGGPNDPEGTPLFDAQLYAGNQFFVVPAAGDFNHDGKVNSADYVMWRMFDGSAEGYDLWRLKFGSLGLGSGGGLGNGAVPEAGSLTLALSGMFLVFGCARRK